MGYPIPTVGGVSLSPDSKAYALIRRGVDSIEDDEDNFSRAVKEQKKLWSYAFEHPEAVRQMGKAPEIEKALAYLALETLREIAIECINIAESHLSLARSAEQAIRYEKISLIQRKCSRYAARTIELINRLS